MKATFHDSASFKNAGPGAVHYMVEGAKIKCPGCGNPLACMGYQMDRVNHTWTPSIQHDGTKDKRITGVCWHGHLTKGEFVS